MDPPHYLRLISVVLLVFIVASILLNCQGKSRMEHSYDIPTPKGGDESEDLATVIVGAGVLGLCTAYHLAKATNDTIRHKLVVVEAAEEVFSATSSTNTGIVSYTGFIDQLLPLAQFSYDQWEDLGRGNAEFRRSCGYREGVNFALKSNGTDQGNASLIPDWVRADPAWRAFKDPPDSKMAIINPVALGAWLCKQCLENGVEFRMNAKAIAAHLTASSHEMQYLRVIHHDTNKTSTIRCDKLVIAAGPWSPGLFAKLFPHSTVKIDPVISAGEWFVFQNPESCLEDEESIAAIYLDDIVGEKLEYAGRNDGTIWTTGVKGGRGEVPGVGEEPEPDAGNLFKLKAYAERFLKTKDALQVVSQGRSYRPATRSGLPVIAEIPACKLSSRIMSPHCRHGRTSVYVNSGHGSYGVTLGMGSGKVMSQIILNQRPDVNVSVFTPSST